MNKLVLFLSILSVFLGSCASRVNPVKEVIRAPIVAFMGVPIGFPTDVTDVLDEKGINYAFVDKMPASIHKAMGAYVLSERKILIKKKFAQSGIHLREIVSHELVHAVRHKHGLLKTDTKEDLRIEEAIAVYATSRVSRMLGFGVTSGTFTGFISNPTMLHRTWKANNLDTTPLTSSQKQYVEQEIQKTLELIKEL